MANPPPPTGKYEKGKDACGTCSGTGKIEDTSGSKGTCGVCRGTKKKQ